MILSELMEKLDGVESYGLYFAPYGEPDWEYGSSKDIPHCEIKDIVKFLDYEVKNFVVMYINGTEPGYLRADIALYI